jgi:dolichyl-phosphate-mannose-protein mannosyltransferase
MRLARRVTTCLLLALVALGVCLRVWNVARPLQFTFDEQLFAPEALHYLLGVADGNDHPPLGKLLVSVGIALFGYNSLGVRFISVCFGLQTVWLAAALSQALFGSRRSALFAAAFFAADGFLVSYSRTGLLDGVLTCFVLWTLLAAVTARSQRDVIVTALLAAAAMSVKWSGAFVVFPAAAAILAFGRVPRPALLWFGVTPLGHALLWMLALRITHCPYDPASLWSLMTQLFVHHQELGHHDNQLASPWYSWLVLYHPIVVKLSSAGFGQRYASNVSNLVWFYPAGLLALLYLPYRQLARSGHMRIRPLPVKLARGLLISTVGWLALLSPWMVGRGTYTFYYHYLPSYACALLGLSGWVAWLESRRPAWVLGFIAAASVVACYYAPVWCELVLSTKAANHRLLFIPWRP